MIRAGRVLAGLVLLSTGLLTVVDRLGNADRAASFAGRWWPVAIAVVLLLSAATFVGAPFPHRPGRALPIVILLALLSATAVLLLWTTNRLPHTIDRYSGAALLITVGGLLTMIQPQHDRPYQTWISLSAILRRTRLRSRARAVRQVTVRAMVGQVALDLTDTSLSGEAEIHASIWGGSVILRLPAGWKVDYREPSGSNLRVDIAPVPDALRKVPTATVKVHLLGIHGRLCIEWAQASSA